MSNIQTKQQNIEFTPRKKKSEKQRKELQKVKKRSWNKISHKVGTGITVDSPREHDHKVHDIPAIPQVGALM